jgi:hypothetical protein
MAAMWTPEVAALVPIAPIFFSGLGGAYWHQPRKRDLAAVGFKN